MQRHRLSAFVLFALVLCGAAVAWAEDFRIETKVFNGKEKSPASHNTTLFHAGSVYDYLSDPDRVAVFDPQHGRFILLDPKRKVKTEVKTADVLAFSEKFHEFSSKSANAFMRFAADPEFDTRFSENGELAMTSPHLTYRVATEPAGTLEAAQQYREFSDWYARFNAMAHVGSTPPFPRMAVDAEMAKRAVVPTEVQLTIPAQTSLGVRAATMRSEHHVSWRLLQRDLNRIAETANQLVTFRQVDFDEYQAAEISKR
jgi:hypothetical protein